MDQDTTVNKLLLNIKEFHVDIPTALAQAYAAGYDERKKDYNQSQEKEVIQEDRDHRTMRTYDSMADARNAVGMSKTGMIEAIKYNKLTRNGHYFRYADKDDRED